MIEHIHQRLQRWADWQANGMRIKGLGYAASSLRPWVPRCTFRADPDYDEEAVATEKAINQLPPELRLVVIVKYIRPGTESQKARDCHVSLRTYYLRVDQAHRRLSGLIDDQAEQKKSTWITKSIYRA